MSHSDTSKDSPDPVEPKGRRLLPEAVLEGEQKWIDASRVEAKRHTTDKTSTGICLSGGGIRSATFNLGVLQQLARLDLLRGFDYLSTVSGGGYIGSCLVSAIEHASRSSSGAEAEKSSTGASILGNDFPLSEADQIHHLRRHGDFLIPRRGLFRKDTLRLIGQVLIGTLVTTFTGATIAMTLAGALILLVWLATLEQGGIFWTSLIADSDKAPNWMLPWIPVASTKTLLTMLIGGAVIGFATGWIFFNSFAKKLEAVESGPPKSPGESNVERRARLYLIRFSSFYLLFSNLLVFTLGTSADAPPFITATVVFVGSLAGLILLYLATGKFSPQPDCEDPHTQNCRRAWSEEFRSFAGACVGVLASITALSLFLPAILSLISWLYHLYPQHSLPSGAALVAAAVWLSRHWPSGPDSTSRFLAIKRILPLILGLVPLALCILGLAAGTIVLLKLVTGITTGSALAMLCPIVIPFIVLFLIFWLVDFNAISPQTFYRDRLAETYLATEKETGLGLKQLRDNRTMTLQDIRPRGGPYPLIQCAINMPGSRDLAKRDRKSDHFIFSPLWTGSTATGWIGTNEYCSGRMDLSKAMAISGAAASSLNGYHSSTALAFLATLFNVRLGLWMPNPLHYRNVVFSDQFTKSRDHEMTLDKVRDRGSNNPLENSSKSAAGQNPEDKKRIPNTRETPGFRAWPGLLRRELTGTAKNDRHYVNLSDGGHTGDNMGLYPLLQRRCQLIVVCDAEADPNYQCRSMACAIQQAFVDENIRVDLDLEPLIDPSTRCPTRHVLQGTVHYPDAPVGRLIYLKSSIVSGEKMPATVHSYASRSPVFPHQSTADQFFDDDQFEAYRALGEHVANWFASANTDAEGARHALACD